MSPHTMWEQWIEGNRTGVINYLLERLAAEPKRAVLEISMFQSTLTSKEADAFRLMWRTVAL